MRAAEPGADGGRDEAWFEELFRTHHTAVLGYARRRGVERVVVNTQEANARALRLYEELGFRRQAGGLAVLKKSL